MFVQRLRGVKFLNKKHDNIFRLIFIEWTKTIKAGGDSTVKAFSAKKRKLNYIIHNPNTVEETAKVLLDVFVQANAGKVERNIRELSNCNNEIRELKEKQAEVAGII